MLAVQHEGPAVAGWPSLCRDERYCVAVVVAGFSAFTHFDSGSR